MRIRLKPRLKIRNIAQSSVRSLAYTTSVRDPEFGTLGGIPRRDGSSARDSFVKYPRIAATENR